MQCSRLSENGGICAEETAVNIDVCSEDIPVHVRTLAHASNEETTSALPRRCSRCGTHTI